MSSSPSEYNPESYPGLQGPVGPTCCLSGLISYHTPLTPWPWATLASVLVLDQAGNTDSLLAESVLVVPSVWSTHIGARLTPVLPSAPRLKATLSSLLTSLSSTLWPLPLILLTTDHHLT